MSSFNAQGGVSIFELCVYFPAAIVAAVVCSRHGFHRSFGWVFVFILCLVRVVGACCQLATYQSETMGLLEAVIILESLGISPLLFATLGLLSRCVDSDRNTSFGAVHFRIIQLVIFVGLILSIAGGTSSISPDGTYQPQTTSEVGIVLYLVAFIALLLIGFITMQKLSNAPTEDRRLVWAVLTALPFILVRIVYSIISVFALDHQFNIITGSAVIHVFVAVIEEMIVVCIYLIVGWMTPVRASASPAPVANRPWKGNLAGRGDTATAIQGQSERRSSHTRQRSRSRSAGRADHAHRHGHGHHRSQSDGGRRNRQGPTHALMGAPDNGRSKRGGPIQMLVGAGITAVQNSRRDGRGEVEEV